MKKILFFSLLCCSVSFAIAQDDDDKAKEGKVARPDIPGSFVIDFGLNRAMHSPTNFNTGFVGSNTLNVYYQYPIRLGKSKFSFNPGAGLSFERFKFTNAIILNHVGARYDIVAGSSKFGNNITKTVLSERYIDVPLEIRFDTKPEDVVNSFNFALGGRVGYLFDSMLKAKYHLNGEKVTNKDKENFGLTKVRYGVYTRVGIGAFNLFFFYNLSSTFQPNKGPDKTTMNTFSTGISINGF